MLLHIFITTITPILIMVMAGYIMDRKFNFNLDTLSCLNFYIISPAFQFTNLYESKYSWESVDILVVTVLATVAIGLGSWGIERFFKMTPRKAGIIRNAILFNNCGNIGIPLVTFIYTNSPYLDAQGLPTFLQAAITVQIVILIFQNILTNSLGFYYAGQGQMAPKDAVIMVLKMPIIYCCFLGIALNLADVELHGLFIWNVVKIFSDALVMIALFTLGVQLARTPFDFFNRDVLVGSVGRLVMAPILTYVCIYLYNVFVHPLGDVANQVMFIGAAVPSGVTTALIAAALKNNADYATQLVVATTLFSSLTLPFFIWIAKILY